MKMSESEILAIANPIMDNLMDASTVINHAQHIKDYTQRMKDITTEEHLQKVCESYQEEKGFFTDREYIALFKRPDSAVIVWKQFFSKVEGEFIAEVLLVYRDKRFLVDHAMVF